LLYYHHMSKKIVYSIGVVLVLAVIGMGGYFGAPYVLPKKSVPPPPRKDLTGIIVAPVAFPLKGYQMQVPDVDGQLVTLNLVSPSAKRDFPMARFSHASTAKETTLVAYDDLVSDEVAGWRSVPISLTPRSASTQWYLARLRLVDEEWQHVDSIYIGEDLKISTVKIKAENVEINYLVHDRNQVPTEVPSVSTTAIISLLTGEVVQAGRVPKTEAVIAYKRFSGEYLWEKTINTESEVITPVKADAFTLRFDGNRIQLETDCNSGSATFSTEPLPANTFSVAPIATTMMFCESVQEAEYFDMVKNIVTYDDTEGVLTFTLTDASQMIFIPKQRALQFENTPSVVASDNIESVE